MTRKYSSLENAPATSWFSSVDLFYVTASLLQGIMQKQWRLLQLDIVGQGLGFLRWNRTEQK